MNKKELLQFRNKAKSKKPLFQRQDSNIFKQFKGEWRKPKGIHSKLRRGFKGHGGIPSIGYSGPNAVKGLTRKGLLAVVVYNINDLKNLDDKNAVIISHSVGMKKRIQIINEIKNKKLHVLGVKDIDNYLSKAAENINSRKKESESKKESKKRKVEEAEKSKEKSKELKPEDKNELKK
ncbi:hypothetical protein HYU23_00280 [Candidatus Woesearchaeota archaeon]|nr:hypothetical protein [Candidatus Woesearchaeota archaeon]